MVYLLHFTKKYKHVQHYIGYTSSEGNLFRRVDHHRNGTGARLMQVVSNAGIDFEIARTWKDGDKNFERQLKNRHGASRFCPICKAMEQESK